MKSTKVETIYFGNIITTKDWKNFAILNLLKKSIYSSKVLTKLQGKETPEEKEIIQNLTKEKVRAELQLQKIRYERQLEYAKQIDNEMTNLIKSNFNEKIAMILQEQWTKQCQVGALKSIQEFSKKEQCFKENWMAVSKSKQALSETLINKKIIYSTKDITEMSITETKTKEEIFSTDLILGTEESNKDTTETQNKATGTT